MKHQAAAIIESFKKGVISESVALTKLQNLTGRSIDLDWFRNYWRAESTEDFIDRICAEPIADFERLTDADALKLIAEYVKTTSPGRRDSIEAALDRRYGKTSGTVCELVFQRDITEPGRILDVLKKDTKIYL